MRKIRWAALGLAALSWLLFLSTFPVPGRGRFFEVLLVPVLLAFGLSIAGFYRLDSKAAAAQSAVSLALSMGLALVLALMIAMGTFIGELG